MNQDHETCPMCGADDYETHRPHWADGVAPFKPFCECRCGATWDEDRPVAQPAVPMTDEEAHNVGERAEELLGHGHGSWDTRPLHEIVHAVLTAAEEMNGIAAAPEKGQQ
jgi:hypothetical protein